MSYGTETTRRESGNPAAAVLPLFGIAALVTGFLFASAIGGGGKAIMGICAGAAVFVALNLHIITRLPHIGRVFAISLMMAAIVTAAAFMIDLERGGW